jgi:hypothetical protein
MPDLSDISGLIDTEMLAEYAAPVSIATIAIYVLVAVALWKVFSKAGYAGILAFIPIVNAIILVKIAGYSAWLVLLYLIPIVNIVFGLMVALSLGRNFGKGAGFSIFWLWIFSFIGYFILGFGSAVYRKA